MERHSKHTDQPNTKLVKCKECLRFIENGQCECPAPPRGRRKKLAGEMSTSSQLLNGRSLLKHTKSNISNVPDSTVRLRPSSDTKTCSEETKLTFIDARVGNECLKYDKEAVNLEISIGSESTIIFENDFDCVDSTRLVSNDNNDDDNDGGDDEEESSQRMERLERTPVKTMKRSTETPAAPVKARHSCPFCSKTFRSNGKLNSHVFSHTGERPFACKHCHKAFSSKFKLVRHLLIHSEDRKFLCTVCERRFLRNDHLKNHYKIHDPRKVVFRCERPNCEKEYSSAMSQKKHEAWHRAQDGDLTCLLCGVKHEAAKDLLLHLRRHSGSRVLKSPADRKFRCHVCERYFMTRKDVTRHLVVHTGERDFLCQFCPQRFGRKDHLVRHIKKSHHAPAKRKINKSILTLNKSKASQTKKLAKNSVTVKEEDETEDMEEEIGEQEEETEAEADADADEKDQNHEQLDEASSSSCETQQPAPIPFLASPTAATIPSEPSLDLFDFPEPQPDPYPLLGDAKAEKKSEDLFEPASQSLMFAEPTFDDDEYKTSDLMLNQGESSAELLRYLLRSDSDTPLPGFNQIFNSCPPNSS